MPSDKTEAHVPSKKESKHILGWVFGIFVLFIALIIVFKGFISGIAMLLLGLFLLPPSRKLFESKINKKIPRVVTGIVGFILFLVSIFAFPSQPNQTSPVAQDTSSNTNSTVNEVTNTTNAPTSTNQADVEPVTTPEVKEEPKPEPSTLDNLWTALDSSIKTRNGYDVKWDEENKTVSLTRTQDTFWDQDDLVEDAYADFVKFGKVAFQVDGVEYVDISYQVPFTDEFGAESIKRAVGLQMNKETFQKFTWENLEYQPIYQTMQDNCEYQFIHPNIRAGLVESELILSL